MKYRKFRTARVPDGVDRAIVGLLIPSLRGHRHVSARWTAILEDWLRMIQAGNESALVESPIVNPTEVGR